MAREWASVWTREACKRLFRPQVLGKRRPGREEGAVGGGGMPEFAHLDALAACPGLGGQR